MLPLRVSSGLFNGSTFPCASPVLQPIDANTTFTEALTPCMALVILPTFTLIIAATGLLFLIVYGYIVVAPALKRTGLVLSKALLSALTVVTAVARLGITNTADLSGDPERVVGRILAVSITFFAFSSYLQCWRRGIVSSIWLHCVWFLNLMFIIPEALYFYAHYPTHLLEFNLILVEAFATLILCVVFCFPDHYGDNYENFSEVRKCNPDRFSSSLSRLWFGCVSEIMAKGFKEKLEYSSLWSLEPRNQPEVVYARFKKHMPALGKRGRTCIPWLYGVLARSTWFYTTATCFLTVIFNVTSFIDPVALNLLLVGISNDSPLWYSCLIITVTAVISLVKFSSMARADYYGLVCHCDIESMLVMAIYEKTLKLLPSVKSKYSAGEIVNMLSTDVERTRMFWFNLMDFVGVPLSLILSLIGLYWMISHNVFYGIAALVIIGPINGGIIYKATQYENQQMELKDERMKLMTDILSGMKVVKLYAWEKSMREQVAVIRAKEVNKTRKSSICFGTLEATFSIYAVVAAVAAFSGYIFVDGHSLTPQVAFVSLMLFNLMRFSVFRLPGLVEEVVTANVSMNRLQSFFAEAELDDLSSNIEPISDQSVLELKDAAFTWDPTSSNPNVIRNLNFTLQRGELVGVIGRVGTGKSSLLSAVCGELQLASGGFFRAAPLSLAYVPQEHWIQNMTFRDNVLFGRAFDEVYYRRTLDACALREDLRLFVAGDATEIGERGLNLSGGQKARVALARAVYQRADLYVLDDTLSAVDSHVGAHIFEHVIGSDGLLGHTTRLFALNSLSYLSRCDRILVLQEGEIVDAGTYPELCARKHDAFVELVRELATRQESVVNEGDEEEAPAEVDDVLRELIGSPSPTPASSAVGSVRRRTTSSTGETPAFTRQVSNMSAHSHTLTHPTPPNLGDGRLVEDEDCAEGQASLQNYVDYAKAFGLKLGAFYLFMLMIVRTALESSSEVWMSKWSTGLSNVSAVNEVQAMVIYATLGMSSSIVVGFCSAILAVGAYQASKGLHDRLLYALLRSPMSFFDTTPMGRILNRLSKDIEHIDGQFPLCLGYCFILIAEFTHYVASAMYVLPMIGLFIIPLIVVSFFMVRYYNRTSVQVRRLTSKSWSAVTSSAQESYIGVSCIRAFDSRNRFTQRMMDTQRTAVECDMSEVICNRWVQMRMDTLTTIVAVCFSITAVVIGHWGWISVGSVALVISTGTMLRGLLGELARITRVVELSAVAVERVQEYIENESEAEWEGEERAPPDWPTRGEIRFEDVSLRYRPTTPLVLHNLNVTIAAGQKVGIVGRTGAGKSSLTLALFRLVEPAGGRILIDGLDCGRLGLHEVRRALTIIPQDPVLFCGDLRANLDPFEELSDADLWQAVERAHLLPFVQQFPNGLRHEIGEGGSNLSVGQRQLVCLARAILRRDTRILVLDEATAAVDLETDRLIQRAIRNEFVHATVLTIAHRLDTILDYDRVLVLEAGEVREFDTPQTLLRNPEGLFHSLAKQAKLV